MGQFPRGTSFLDGSAATALSGTSTGANGIPSLGHNSPVLQQTSYDRHLVHAVYQPDSRTGDGGSHWARRLERLHRFIDGGWFGRVLHVFDAAVRTAQRS